MRRFQFRLTTLLRLREATRDERRMEIAQAYEARQILEQRAAEIAASRDEADASRRDELRRGQVNVDRLVDAQRHLLALKGEALVLQQQAEALAQETQRRHEALVAADRDVRVLDKLREKHRQRHHRQRRRAETKRLDEIAQRRATAEGED